MSGVVGAVDRVIRFDRDAVRSHREHTLAPCSDEASIPLVDHHRMLRAAKKKDAILRIDGDRGHVGMRVARGELLPGRDGFVARCNTDAHSERAPFVSSTSRAICADRSAGLANAISSRNLFTNATSTSSPYSSPGKSRRYA